LIENIYVIALITGETPILVEDVGAGQASILAWEAFPLVEVVA
jgi:hypothetical protein